MKAEVIISLLLVHASFVMSASRLNSRRLHLDDEGNPGDAVISQEREDRKLVFINNKAYDLSEADEAKVLEQFVENGQVSQTNKLQDSATTKETISDISPRESIDDEGTLVHKQGEAVKASRFVADKKKAQLIEKVDEDDIQKMRDSATTTQPDERVATEAPTETSTIRYEYTQVSVLSFLWNEVRNLGELLGREMIGSLSGTLYYLWESVVRVLQANSSRKVITDMSSDL